MAAFKVGQRVRMIRGAINEWTDVGTVIGPDEDLQDYWTVRADNHVSSAEDGCYCCASYQLVPLTDPKADEFIERIKNLKPYEEPTRNPFADTVSRWLEAK